MRVHSPSTSFIGYFSRRSLCTSSRTEAPLAQCEPRLIGLSQLGSWPIHTPLDTSAVTVQPTAQCVQMFLWIVTVAPGAGGGPAFALRTLVSGSVPRAARPPAARPERSKKARRSTCLLGSPAKVATDGWRFCRSVLLISMIASPLARITVDAVIGFHVIAFLVARLLLFGVAFGVGFRLDDKRRCGGGRRTCAKPNKELTAFE